MIKSNIQLVNKGFGLVDLFLSLLLLSILFLIPWGIHKGIMRQSEITVITNEITNAIQFAKVQALAKQTTVFLYPLNSKNWAAGMTLKYSKKNKKKDEIIQQWQWSHPAWNLTWLGADGQDHLVISNHPYRTMTNGRFILTEIHTNTSRIILVNKLGRLRIED